jgi:hypothetical protein
MTISRLLEKIISALTIALAFSLHASAQSSSPSTAGEFWPAVDAHIQLADNLRLLGFVGLKNGEEFPYQQLNTGIGLGYQWKRISKLHLENIDQDKEHVLVFGTGYEYLQTFQSGQEKSENRWVLQATPALRPLSRLLVRDRNRIELRWVNGVYSTRYRNNLSLEYDLTVRNFRFTPYASAEIFYDGAKSSWNEEQYTVGLQWPYKRILMLETYYLRQHTTSSSPAYLNVGGLTLNIYFANKK